ncbi:hypothetical protein KVV02_006771 [Mortierella alpina]|uniref:Kinesin-like protein n=1 Tax=Mortierella alpina TaxID=64518 RepID=A0A9P8AA31_MORAP|nr:hypothetical protein KVV02_006771 [Mortierella alpina]
MFKSVADRLGFPHSSSSHSLSSHHASGPSSPTSNSTGSHHHRSIFSSSPSSARSPSRQQQHQQQQQHSSATSPSSYNNGSRHIASTGRTTPLSGGRTTPAPPPTNTATKPRKPSASTAATPKPVLPPLTFQQQPHRASQNLAQSVASAGGVAVEEDLLASSTVSRAAENITVAVRVRPFSVAELRVAGGPTEVWTVEEDSRRIRYADDYSLRERRAAVDYAYDHALTGSDNELIYSTSVKNLVQSAMEGYNGTVFAYGQTSSGKTYTMSGTEKQPGITPRAVEDVFKYIRENSEREFLLRVSYLEIYNESIRDLLSPEAIDLRIHEDRKRGVYVSPLKEEIVTTPSQVMRILQRGDYQRHTSTTDYNAHSSRSHSIFQIVIESRERAPTAPQSPEGRKPSLGSKAPTAVRVSQLNLIDLAGSEKASTDMERRKEGAFINKSLLTLGTVISKLTDERGSHIPYRDSKLTRILQSSLSGNARVSVICTISPSFLNVEESHNTLKFAARVKKVVTKAHTNQVMDDKALLEKYRREISELKTQLLLTAASTTSSMGEDGSTARLDQGKHAELSHLLERERLKHEEEMVEMNMIRNALKERIDHLTKLILTSQSINSNNSNNAKGSSSLAGRPSSTHLPLMGRYTVETTADGTVLEFPKEIESRLARKDTIVRQLQTELESQQEKVSLMKAALQKTAKGEVVDIEKTLARVEMEPQRERFLIEKRASIMNLNAMMWQDGGAPNGVHGGSMPIGAHGRSASGLGKRSTIAASSGTVSQSPLAPSALEHDLGKDNALVGEHLAIDDLDDDDDDLLMDTPWNRAELSELRQAKRELEIVVIDQEKKLEDMVAFEDSEEFRNLVIELEEQREKILTMEEEREAMRAMITDFKNTIRKLEWGLTENGNQSKGGAASLGGMAMASPTQTLSASSIDGPSSSSSHAAASAALLPAAASRIQELEAMLQREKKLRMEEQARSMSRVASLEAEVTILKAEQSVRGLEEAER